MTKYSPEPKGERALPLNERIGRLAQSLVGSFFAQDPESASDDALGDVVDATIREWRERWHYLPGELLSDPAWGMLLELLRAELRGERASISRICWASAVSTPTAIRWLKALENRGLASRRADPDRAGAEFVQLTSKGSAALRRYFREVPQRVPRI